MPVRLLAAVLGAVALASPAAAQPQERPAADLPPVTISARRNPDPQVEKSYRRMLRGMDLFEREQALAPQAALRFRVLPRKRDTDLDDLGLYVLGRTVQRPVPVAPDRSFVLERDDRAWQENAVVSPDRKARSMTWRAEVRTPGLPPGTRRLGDLRLECRVGMEAGLVSDNPSWVGQLVDALADTPAYCERPGNRYLFFAERALFGVTLVDGGRREQLPVARLYAAALGERRLAEVLPACDCEVLLDRAYFLPLEDRGWPDDTRIEFEFMEDGDAAR